MSTCSIKRCNYLASKVSVYFTKKFGYFHPSQPSIAILVFGFVKVVGKKAEKVLKAGSFFRQLVPALEHDVVNRRGAVYAPVVAVLRWPWHPVALLNLRNGLVTLLACVQWWVDAFDQYFALCRYLNR